MSYNQYIDHTLLKPDATMSQIKKLCEEAMQYHFKSVCVNPCYVEYCYSLLKDTDVDVCTVIGFPLGSNTTNIKVLEAKEAINNGAREIDMVINVGLLKMGEDEKVYEEIKAVVDACAPHTVKVILETCLLTDEEIVRACHASMKAHADFVKTSTGFSTGGATIKAVSLMKETVKDECLVKASGGIRSFEDAKAMIDAGASRIGTSSGIEIIKEEK